MAGADEVRSQQLRQDAGVDLVGLDLGLSDDARLVRVGHRDAADLGQVLQQIVKPLPGPGALKDHAAGPRQSGKERVVSLRGVPGDPAREEVAARRVHNVDHAVLTVVINAAKAAGLACRSGLAFGAAPGRPHQLAARVV